MSTLRTVLYAVLALGMLTGCGKKSPPLWVEPKPLAPPVMTSVLYRAEGAYIAWTAPEPAEAYLVERGSAEGGGFVHAATAKTSPYFDKDARIGDLYRVYALPKDTRGRASLTSNVMGGSAQERPARPTGLVATVNMAHIELAWQPSVHSVRYNVYRGPLTEVLTIHTPLNPTPLREPRMSDLAMPRDEVYYIVRAAQELGGGVIVEGDPEGPLHLGPDSFIPTAPAKLGAVPAATGGKVLLFWDEAPEPWIEGYRIYRAEGEAEFRLIGESPTPAYSDDQPPAGQRLRYMVRSQGPSLEGEPSAIVNVPSPL